LALLERAGAQVLDTRLLSWTGRVVAASLGMGALLWLLLDVARPFAQGALALALLLMLSAVLAGAVYVMLLELLGVRDSRQVLSVVRERVARRPAS
jgi:hypothetical protein